MTEPTTWAPHGNAEWCGYGDDRYAVSPVSSGKGHIGFSVTRTRRRGGTVQLHSVSPTGGLLNYSTNALYATAAEAKAAVQLSITRNPT